MTPLDEHPCGPEAPLSHSWVKGECEDCGFVCEHDKSEFQQYDDGRQVEVCSICDEDIEPYDDSDDRYEAHKDRMIEEGRWPTWR